ncbi:CLAVATA3/ESR-RELATED [Trifolium repens]|nr:CLAVATA3/ESR-RELATED [Trifolium repens]
MWFGSGRKLMYFSMMMFLVTTLLQILVSCHMCQVGAIRIFPGNVVAKVEFNKEFMYNKINNKDLLNKYFKGRTFFESINKNETKMGFDDSKRKVPSCPDPLHN